MCCSAFSLLWPPEELNLEPLNESLKMFEKERKKKPRLGGGIHQIQVF